ncbi:MAG TPA: DUF4011 domain-containing protein [Ruminococcus sp.]|nr:DUF4011 domain-containing protein [Ruminococcus sp.]
MDNMITFGGSMTAQINFAMQQNYVPVFRSITLTNITDSTIDDVHIRVRFEPEFANVFESAAVTLPPSQPVEIAPVNIVMSADYLFSLTEKLVGSVTIEALKGDEVIASEVRSIELLAYDQWTGVNFMPETAAAFITPNHPKVQEIISKASLFLQKWTGDPAFTGYQSRNANIVKQQMGAIYAALQAENIAYTMPPASYETAQRIRTPDAVLEGKAGTCLDLTVLYCTCLENIGLNPLILLVRGHAFAGCWLSNETFPDCLQYDVSAITKRIAKGINAISLVECTEFVAGRSVDFDDSESHAAAYLSDPAEFLFAIDVIRTRSSGIRPMPSRVAEGGSFKAVDYGERKRKEITDAPNEIDIIGDVVPDAEPKEVTKQMIWERKLLDLSLRNSLLNFRPTSSSVQLMITDMGVLEDEIANGEEFRIMPVPNDMSLEVSDSKIFELENDKEHISAIAESEFKSRRIRTFLSESELDKIMKKLVRMAKVSIEENGANTIYIAMGFLRWYETDKSDKARYAPLVLVPVDIIRKVQDKSYSIKVRDEDTQVNITMLEMLRQFFGININGLDPVPEDENGVNLQLIFNTIRQGIMAKNRWDIEEYAFVGQFSFTRFIMWNDIRNRADELAKNKVVASLISGKTEWEGENIDMSPLSLDNKIAPTDLAVPVAADSSQLAAVYAANSGNSFVLHGPPGSGKSQTITNMIANALHHGKTVLFVAEKMAALEVVEKRLNKIGLGPFCLELHSNKAQKRAVLKQLEETLNVGKVKEPGEYKAQADKISELRAELNGTMEEIHKVRSYGMSLYDAAVRYEQSKEYGGKFSFSRSQLDLMNETTYSGWKGQLESLTAAGAEFGDVTSTPLKYCRLTECTPETRDAVAAALDEFKGNVASASGHTTELCGITGSDKLSLSQCMAVSEILTDALGDGYILPQVVSGGDWDIRREQADKLIESGRGLKEVRGEVLDKFENTVLAYDVNGALVNWKTAQSKWFLPKFFKTKKLVKELAAHAKASVTVTKDNIAEHYVKLNRLGELSNVIKNAPTELTGIFGAIWNGEETDWDMASRAVELSQGLRDKLNASTLAPEAKKKLAEYVTQHFGTPSDKQSNKSAVEKLTEDNGRLGRTVETLSEKFRIDCDAFTQGENWAEDAVTAADGIISALPQLKEWTGIVTLSEKLNEMGIGNVADNYLSGKVKTSELISSFDSDLCRALVTDTISTVPALAKFQGALFEETIRKYGEVLDKFSTLTINELVAELSAKIPTPGSSAASSEIGILQKAIKSNGRMMSIRKLFDSIPNLLRRMCPVMLMSPISVAQYIDPSYPKFDLVIFDEASQLPTCEAVGAIARGENVIVVGDPKQLPPTSFFSSNQTDEENYEKEDLESVLDDCLALSMPQQHLLWHYRSRHESLIAYSNAKYYENKLFTFPSPDDRKSMVSWVHVDGYYDKSSTRTNKAEAKAIVEEIARRLEDPQLRKQSIGVVTFSLPQQNLVDDMLTDAFRERPELETWANEQYEPILIKNLENVQGDERDVILFSIGYGPDKEGKVSMNFGPLNRDGGWRRLNVAISRSKCEMIVFSVITPDMIDLSRTRSDGVEGLKGFLEFAAKGRSALAIKGNTASGGNGFESVVAEELKKRGYSADTLVGCSNYKVDVAVVNPDDPEKYILGINCGGKSNYINGTSKDRHISQAGVLEGLGWNVMNVYILDWLDNKEKTVKKIEDAVAEALERYRHPETAPKAEEKPKQELVFEKEEVSELSDLCDKYVPFKVKSYGKSTTFTDANSAKILACVRDILQAEAPISRNALTKKVYACFDVPRASASSKKLVEEAVSRSGAKITSAGENEFLWLADQSPERFDKCRAVCSDENKRNMDDIAPEEIAVGIKLIMSRQVSMTREDLIRETAHLFGFARVSPTIETAVSLGIRSAKNSGYIDLSEDGRVSYSE